MATDPVCGMAVEREAAAHYRYDRQTHHFGTTACRDEFTANPGRFLHRLTVVSRK